MVVIRAYVEK